jgi:hypothetical protein
MTYPIELGSLTGKVFGEWSVGERVEDSSHPTYYCTCSCGESGKVRSYHLLIGDSTRCGKCRSRLPRPKGRLTVTGTCRAGHSIAVVGIAPGGTCRLCRWEAYVKRTYDITAEEYLAIYQIQNGKCAICGRPLALPSAFGMIGSKEDDGRTEVDHKHVPKKVKPQPTKRSTVRGLLCGGRYAGCNAKLGHVDNPIWLQAAATYLLNPPAQQLLKESETRNTGEDLERDNDVR